MNINTKDSFNSFNYFPTVSGPSANLVFKKNRVPHVSAPREQRSVRSVRSVCRIKKIRVQIKNIRLIREICVQRKSRNQEKFVLSERFVFKKIISVQIKSRV